MGTFGNKISQAPETLSRPSLLSTGRPSADHNILDAMPGRSKSAETVARPLRQWWWLLPLLAATAWGISTQPARPPAASPAPTAATQAVDLAVKNPSPAAGSIATVSASASATAVETTVTIPTPDRSPDPFQSLTTDPAMASALPENRTENDRVTRLHAALDAPATQPLPTETREVASQNSTPSVVEKKPVITPAQKASAAASRSQDNAAASVAVRKTLPSKAQASTPHPQQTRSNATVQAKAGNRDPDVELLSAVMKHLGDGKGSAAADAPARSPQTIADLIKTCRTKDSIEALLCQRRICEGSWGKAQACPKEQAPRTTAAQAPT